MTVDINSETRFTGLPISGGLVVARVCLFRQSHHNDLPPGEVSDKSPDQERERLQRATDVVVERLESLREKVAQRIGPAEAEIFVAQTMILRDPVLGREMDQALGAGYNAESAVLHTFDNYEAQLRQIDDEYLKERASDITELKRRLLDVLRDTRSAFLCSARAHCRRGRDRIVLTRELTPTATLEMETDRLLGFVTARGGATSHAAILARALGIPAVSGIAGIHEAVPCGTEVLLDGNTGEVVVRPSPQTKAGALARIEAAAVSAPSALAEPVGSLRVMANISVAADVAAAGEAKAEGVGLYRTEFEFFAANRLLNEDEQYALYSHVVTAMGAQPVYFRMLDIGADKTSPVFGLPEELNPSLGLRGARLLLARPELLREQARALARVSAIGLVHVMYPMIADVEQFRRLRELFDESTADLPDRNIRHGLMFEVPSACLAADELLEIADFASIGSNDLIQYLFAVDRNNESVAHDFRTDGSALWRLLGELAAAADRAGKPLSLCGELAADTTTVCGELAADTTCTGRLLSVGIQSVSVSSRHIASVRRAAVTAKTG
jgi:phosphotransferase system enzyme I (PtsI)